jgi:hypothetical protein
MGASDRNADCLCVRTYEKRALYFQAAGLRNFCNWISVSVHSPVVGCIDTESDCVMIVPTTTRPTMFRTG